MFILIKNGRGNIGLEKSSTNSQHVETESKGTDGMTGLNDAGNGSDYHNDVGNTTDCNTNVDDGLESTPFGVCQPSTEDWSMRMLVRFLRSWKDAILQSMSQECEGIGHCRGDNCAFPQSTGGLLSPSFCGSSTVSTFWKLPSDKVLEDLFASIWKISELALLD